MPPTPSPTPLVVQLVGGESSFWDSPFILALLPLAGVVVGTLLGYFLNKASEKRKAAEAKAQRWDQNVLTHTSTVIIVARSFILDMSDYHATLRTMEMMAVDQMRSGKPVDPPPVDVPARRIARETYETLLNESVALKLVAPEPVREAVRGLQHYAGLFFLTTEKEDFDEYANDVKQAAINVEDAVRKYFEIS